MHRLVHQQKIETNPKIAANFEKIGKKVNSIT